MSDWLQTEGLKSAGTMLNLGRGVASTAVNLFMIIVISFYMLIDGRRIHRFFVRALPGDADTNEAYLTGVQISFTRYVKGQFALGSGRRARRRAWGCGSWDGTSWASGPRARSTRSCSACGPA